MMAYVYLANCISKRPYKSYIRGESRMRRDRSSRVCFQSFRILWLTLLANVRKDSSERARREAIPNVETDISMLNNVLEFSKRSKRIECRTREIVCSEKFVDLFAVSLIDTRLRISNVLYTNVEREVGARRDPTSRVALSIDVYLAAGRSLSVDE